MIKRLFQNFSFWNSFLAKKGFSLGGSIPLLGTYALPLLIN
jgi:hypothetical protein